MVVRDDTLSFCHGALGGVGGDHFNMRTTGWAVVGTTSLELRDTSCSDEFSARCLVLATIQYNEVVEFPVRLLVME